MKFYQKRIISVKKTLKEVFCSFFKHEKWIIGIVNKKIQDIYKDGLNINEIQWLSLPSKKNSYSDPFGIEIFNKSLILFENYNYRNQKGIVSAFLLHKKKSFGPIDIIIKPFHLSYPYPIKYKDDFYCIPESHKSNKILLFKCIEFPYDWKLCKILMKDKAILDPTIIYYNNKWWLFCSKHNGFPNSNLYIFYANSLFGPWKGHDNNPVKIDIKSSRPAGTPFFFDGNLIRPAQDCSKTYGYQIIFNKVLILDEFDFKECSIRKLKIGKKYNGIHTISSIGNNTLIDVKFFHFSFYLFRIRVEEIINKFINFLKGNYKIHFQL